MAFPTAARLAFRGFVLDGRAGTLRDPTGALLPLQKLPFGLLHWLARHPRQVFSRDALDEQLWPDTHVSDDALTQAVRRIRLALGAEASAVRTVARRGYMLDADVTAETPGAEPAPAPSPAVDGPPAGLYGRDALWASLVDAIPPDRPDRLLTLVGPGGVGKTRLVSERFPQAVFVELAGAADEHDVCRAVAARLALPAHPEPAVAIGGALAERSDAVLVLDEAEAVVEPVARLVPRWLAVAEGLRVVVTSRQPLGLPQERVVPVDELDPAASLALLCARAPDLDPAAPETARLAAATEGLPLAIELLASRARYVPPDRLLALIEADALGVLADPRPGGREVHRSMRAALSRSLVASSPEDRSALVCLSRFVGRFSFDRASAAIGPEAIDALQRLMDASLVRHGPEGFHVYTTVRQLLDDVADPEDLARARERHARCLLDGVLTASDVSDAKVALQWAIAARDAEVATALACRLDDLLIAVAGGTRVQPLQPAVAFARAVQHPRSVELRGRLADALRQAGRPDEAIAELEAVVAELDAAGSPTQADNAALILGTALAEAGRDAEAVGLLTATVARCDARGDEALAAKGRVGLAIAHLRERRVEPGVALLREALAWGAAGGFGPQATGQLLGNLATAEAMRERFDVAYDLAEQALAAYRDAGHAVGEGAAIVQLAEFASKLGRRGDARHWLAEGERRQSTFDAEIAIAFGDIAVRLAWEEGRPAEALRRMRLLVTRARRLAMPFTRESVFLHYVSLLQRVSADVEAALFADAELAQDPSPSLAAALRVARASARLRADDVVGAAQDLDRARGVPIADAGLAAVAARTEALLEARVGRFDAAAARVREAASRGVGSDSDTREWLALIELARGRPRDALRALGDPGRLAPVAGGRADPLVVRCVALAAGGLPGLGPALAEAIRAVAAAPPLSWPVWGALSRGGPALEPLVAEASAVRLRLAEEAARG